MRILIIHHVEPMWASSFGRDEIDYLFDIEKHLQENSYDKTITTSMEGDGYKALQNMCDAHEEWAYGWEDPEDHAEWYTHCKIDASDIIPVSGHDFAYIYPWIKELKGHTISVLGGAKHECLRDLCDTFDHLDIEYNVVKELVYG